MNGPCITTLQLKAFRNCRTMVGLYYYRNTCRKFRCQLKDTLFVVCDDALRFHDRSV